MPTDPVPASPPNSPPVAPPASPPPPVARSAPARARPNEVVVYHHSPLFYWWPVWLLGFILAGVTYFEDHHMVVVPPDTKAAEDRLVEVDKGSEKLEKRDVLILPRGEKLLTHKDKAGQKEIDQPKVFVSRHKGLGTLFIAVLLFVITITNVPMRGLWSVFVIITLILLAILFAVAGWWEPIFRNVKLLATYINLSGYVLLSTVLLIIWVINFYIMDRQTYIVFTPGQVRVRLEIGGGETVFDTTGMVVQKQRSDLFRHWILGFGSGDLLVRPAGIQHPIELPNVLNVGRLVKAIEIMVKEKVVVSN